MAITLAAPVLANPADIVNMAAPGLGESAPKAQDIAAGDASVATQTGSLNYSYPIKIAPGRNGMAPSLSLSYSSQAPIYGGVAAGWSLSIPDVRWDVSNGRLRYFYELNETDPDWLDEPFVSSLAGGRPLVKVTGDPIDPTVYATLRAQNDSGFHRFQRMNPGQPFRWRVFAPDGITHYFGDTGTGSTGASFITNSMSASIPTADLLRVRAPLTRTVDAFSNTVEYYWLFADNELRISSIRYSVNPGSGVPAFAEVLFTYGAEALCQEIPVGSQSDYRAGLKLIEGRSRLSQIVARALDPATGNPVHTRQITLGYEASVEPCTLAHSPYRQLTSIAESAWHDAGDRVDLPAVTFEYGGSTLVLSSPVENNLWGGFGRTQNLGWGYRFQGARWPTVEAMMVDVDGDSLIDRLVNTSDSGTGPGLDCKATWWRNPGNGGGFTPQPEITLPRLPWGTYLGVPDYKTAEESCALNYQVTRFQNVIPESHCQPASLDGSYVSYRWLDIDGNGVVELVTALHNDRLYDPTLPGAPTPTGSPWPSCPGDQAACPDLSAPCMNGSQDCRANEPCVMRPNWVAACEALAPRVACPRMMARLGGPLDLANLTEPDPDNEPPTCPFANDTHAFKLPCNLFPWHIYDVDRQTGALSLRDTKLQPVSLESDTGDSSLGGSEGFWAGQHGVTDVDGDGFIDVIHRGRFSFDDPPPTELPYWWWMYVGDGNGGFLKDPGTGLHQRYFFQIPTNFWISRTDIQSQGLASFTSTATQQLVDVNGDGAVDYLNYREGLGLEDFIDVHFNDGLRLRLIGGAYADLSLAPTMPGGSQSKTNVTGYVDPPGPGPIYITAGNRSARIRWIDMDADGRSDLFRYDVDGFAHVHFNAGGNVLVERDPNAGMGLGLTQQMTLTDDGISRYWEAINDLMDLDGDGLPEALQFQTGSLFRLRYDAAGMPPRLMTQVTNGRGLKTEIRYAPLSETDTVDNKPPTPSDPGSKASPRTAWVVKSIKTIDAFDSSDATTTYRYDDPVFGSDDKGRFAFRGFKQVTATGPRGNQTVQRYGFGESGVDPSPDWSGRLVATVTKLDDTVATSIAEQTWTTRQLFGISITTYHPDETRTYVCRAGQGEVACKADPAGFTYSKSTWTAQPSSSAPGVALLHVESETTTQDSVAFDDGDRKAVKGFYLYTGGDAYRLRPTTTESKVRVSGVDELYASTETVWDSMFRVALQDQTLLAFGATPAVTERTFDMATGNVLTVKKPVQVAAIPSGPFAANTYDSRKLFVSRLNNELGHVLETDHDYGTGAVTSTRGPNTRQCTTNCPPDPPEGPLPRMEEERTKIDGLGRPLEIEVTIAYPGVPAYQFSKVETFSYVDTATPPATPTVPTSVVNKKRIEHTENRWTEVKTEMDGHGRPIKTTEKVNGTAPSDAVTTFDYDEAGKLIAVAVPDPTQNNTSQVTFTYSFDSIGRPTGMRRPDSTDPALRTGVDISYDGETLPGVRGVREIRTEVGPVVVGQQFAKTELVSDDFGRLTKVREFTTSSVFAETTYAYSPRDEVMTIVDPDFVTTQLDHDLGGRRIKITRGSRTWKYGYDRNGNMLTVISPVPGPQPPSQATLTAYTTSIAYDALDRMTSKAIAPRDLSLADRELFGATEVTLDWDQSLYNRMGQIAFFNRKAPSGALVFNGRYFYDPEGNPTIEDRDWNISGVDFPELEETANWSTFGKPHSVYFADPVPPDSYTRATTIYDDRGNPLKLNLQRQGINTNMLVGVQTRNVAGLVTKRRTDQTGQAMTFIESNWTYDKLGRVTSQVVQKGPGPVQVARQDLAYWGADDPKTLDHWLGASNHKRLEFAYDKRHQLTGVSETLAGGAFSGTYAFRNSGRFDSATVAAAALPGGEVRTRNVAYEYDAADPEAVSQLTIASGPQVGTPYATYTYDESGNQTSRTYRTDASGAPISPYQVWAFQYDGEDQLRRATSPDGSVEEYWYDHNGKRALIRKTPSGGSPIEWRWFHHNTEIEWQTDNAADLTPTIVHTMAYASMGTPVARIQDRNDRTEYQFHGLASSTLATVESGVGILESGDPASPPSGTTNAAFTYSPWGEVIETVGGETTTHRRRLNDKYHDASTGLAYYGFRYYDQVATSWTQADPLYRFAPDAAWAAPRRSDLYVFDLNNPLRYLDPDGRNPWVNRGRSIAIANAVVKINNKVESVANTVVDVVQVVATLLPVGRIAQVAIMVGNAIIDEVQGQNGPIDPSSVGPPAPPGGGAPPGSGGPRTPNPNADPRIGGLGSTPAGNTAPKNGTAGGDRAGKDFTPAGKRAVREENRKANGGKLKCEICGRDDLVDPKRAEGGQPRPKNEGQVDHVIPKKDGGDGSPPNGQVLCPECNADKGTTIQ